MGLVYTDKVAGKPAKVGAITATTTTGNIDRVTALNTIRLGASTPTALSGFASAAGATAATDIAAMNVLINGTPAVVNTQTGSQGAVQTAATPGLAGLLAAAQTARANSIAATGAAVANTSTVATAPTAGSDAAVALAALNLAEAQAILAAISGAAAVPAVDSTIALEKQMTVTMSGSVETTSGLTFGASLNLRSNEKTGTVAAGARVSMATNGFEVGVGNIYGAIDSMPNLWNGIGLTGLGHGFVVANTDAKGVYKWDAYSSSGNGAEGIEVIYSAGGFTGHLSYSDKELSKGASAVKTVAAFGAYTMGDWTVAIAMQDSEINANDKTIVTVGGKVGDYGVKLAAADNDGVSKISLAGSATMGATTVTGYVANEESGANTGYGLGLSHDLGGAALKAGLVRSTAGRTSADMGVSFSF